MAHRAGDYPGSRSMKLDGTLVHPRVTPSSDFAVNNLYTWVEKGTMRVKCLVQEHNAVPRLGLEPPRPPDLESNVLAIRPPRLPSIDHAKIPVDHFGWRRASSNLYPIPRQNLGSSLSYFRLDHNLGDALFHQSVPRNCFSTPPPPPPAIN